MLPDRVPHPGPLTYESGALPIALRGPAKQDTEEAYNRIPFILHAVMDSGVPTLGLACFHRDTKLYSSGMKRNYFCIA